MFKKLTKLLVPKSVLKSQKDNQIISDWEEKGCPAPPPHVIKQRVVKEYRDKFRHKTFIETGTYYGDMVEAQKKHFEKIYSIELSEKFYQNCVERFKNDKDVEILHGDSGKVLSELMKEINEPVIFWLDGHYSGGDTAKGDKECPIYEELEAILDHKSLPHVILIDDARLFVGQKDYPTINELKNFVKSKNENFDLEIKHDIIRFTP